MTWIYQGTTVDQLPEDCLGFVYIITNLITGRRYIGKKLAKFSKTQQKTVRLKNGTKKRKRVRSLIDSDWREYYGSNQELINDVAEQGPENFTREILYLCISKAEMSYIEAREQFERRVLESDDYYNGIINLRVGDSPALRKALLRHVSN